MTIVGDSRAGVVVAPAAEDVGDGSTPFDGAHQHGFMVVADDVTISTLTIEGAGNNLANGGVLPDHNNFRTGIANYSDTADGFDNLRVEDVDIRHVREHGISLGYYGGSANSGHVVTGCNIEDVEYRRGVSSYAASTTITFNTFDSMGMGIYISPSPALPANSGIASTITDNTLTNISGHFSLQYGHSWPSVGIYFRNPNNDAPITVSRNMLTLGYGDEAVDMVGVTGMYIYNADSSSVISDNTFDTTGGTDNWGIYLGGCAGTTVSGNTFTMNDTDRGIYLAGERQAFQYPT